MTAGARNFGWTESVSSAWRLSMRIALITLLVSTVVSVCFWNFGWAIHVWPAHPFLATLAIAIGFGVAVQLLLARDAASRIAHAKAQ